MTKILITEDQTRRIINELFSQALIQKLIDKFHAENPALEEKDIRYYLQRFEQIKDSPNVKEKDINKYSWKQLEILVDTNQQSPYDIKVSDSDLLYDQNGLKIYLANTTNACITYGNGYSFCISARSPRNAFKQYRYGFDFTTYFVIDSNRSTERYKNGGKFIDPNHLLVIMVKKHTYPKDNKKTSILGLLNPSPPDGVIYKMTDANNEKEDFISYDEIVQLQPKLKGLEKYLIPREYDKKELAIYNLEQEYNKMLVEVANAYKNKITFYEAVTQQIIDVNEWPLVHSIIYKKETPTLLTALNNEGKIVSRTLVHGKVNTEKWKKESNAEFELFNNPAFIITKVNLEPIELPPTYLKYLEKVWKIMVEFLNERNRLNYDEKE